MQSTQVALPLPYPQSSTADRPQPADQSGAAGQSRAAHRAASIPTGLTALGDASGRHTANPAKAPLIPVHALPHRSPAELLVLARRGLAEAAQTRPDGLRYAAAHLAALRAAAALLAARARPAPGRRGRVTSVWSLLVLVAPEFSEWASFFATSAGKRAAAEAGIPRVVTADEADDLLRAAEQFVALVEVVLGVAHQPMLADADSWSTSASAA